MRQISKIRLLTGFTQTDAPYKTIPTYGESDSKEVNTSTTLSVKFSGRRIRTKLYRAGNGLLIHADVNGSLNILRKVVPTAFSLGIEGVVVRESRGYSRQTKGMRYLSMFFGTMI